MAAICVTANELNAIKTLALSQASLARLGYFPGKEEMLKQVKAAKKAWWAAIRQRYNLNLARGQKLSVEMDGDLAGQLRYKARNHWEKSDSQRRALRQADRGYEGQNYGPSGRCASEAPSRSRENEEANRIAQDLNSVLQRAGLNLRVNGPR